MPAPENVHQPVKRFEDHIERLSALELHKRSPKTPQEQEMVKREIEPSTDEGTDRFVYEMYGLTEDDVKVVEGSVK